MYFSVIHFPGHWLLNMVTTVAQALYILSFLRLATRFNHTFRPPMIRYVRTIETRNDEVRKTVTHNIDIQTLYIYGCVSHDLPYLSLSFSSIFGPRTPGNAALRSPSAGIPARLPSLTGRIISLSRPEQIANQIHCHEEQTAPLSE